MLTGVTIRNFRGFRDMTLDGLARVNLLVGDNGSGKTALLEAIFLAMSNGAGVALGIRSLRGLSVAISPAQLGVFSEFIGEDAAASHITTRGDGPFARDVEVRHEAARTVILPPTLTQPNAPATAPPTNAPASAAVFRWQDAESNSGEAVVQAGPAGLALGVAPVSWVGGEFVSAGLSGQGAAAATFSALDTAGDAGPFVAAMQAQFPEIEALAVQLDGGQPLLHARLRGQRRQRPLELLSGGMTRLATLLLPIANPAIRLVLIDEIENGLHHSRFQGLWQQIREFATDFKTQVFATTHSLECLDAAAAAMAEHPDDFAFIRTTRLDAGCTARLLPGADASLLLRSGLEVRG